METENLNMFIYFIGYQICFVSFATFLLLLCDTVFMMFKLFVIHLSHKGEENLFK